MIAILDYEIGNIRSLQNALKVLGYDSVLTSNRDEIMKADKLIIPGVGAFPHGMEAIKKNNLEQVIRDFVTSGKHVLGICLGFQILCLESEEFGKTEGFGFLPAKVKKLEVSEKTTLPHIGWKQVEASVTLPLFNPLFKDVERPEFYFVHSFGVILEGHCDFAGYTTYDDYKFSSILMNKNVLGVQFHPEKSGEMGLRFLKNFLTSEKL